MEAKGEARRNLEAAIRQLDQTTEKAKQYNAAMTKAMEETRADIEKLKAEAAAAEAQARAEALAETERQAAAEASSQNVDNLSQLARELQNRQIALEQRLDEVNRENATLRQAANETLAQTAGRMATAFLKKHNRRIPPFLSKYNY
jgi:Rps23 Pro-64 3,4-dihydroxylase Tpa1-like proline 4-hydroxylase